MTDASGHPPHAVGAERAMRRAEWQPYVHAPQLKRLDVLRLQSLDLGAGERLRLKVFRNHAFEYVAPVLERFAAFAGYELVIELNEYDDTMSDVKVDGDIVLVWLDFLRYERTFASAQALSSWLVGRVAEIRRTFRGPILVANHVTFDTGDEAVFTGLAQAIARALAGMAGVHTLDLQPFASDLGADAVDARVGATGTRWSAKLGLEAARVMGLQWIPASMAPRAKGIVLDLDHTLYAGVLGEDGAAGLVLTQGHRALQQQLIDWRAAGTFLAVVSRNEPTDVDAMFVARPDFPLRPEHISAWAVGWSPKSHGIMTVADQLRVGVDSLVFLDDNPGELAAAAAAHAKLRTVHATPNADLTLRALQQTPGLFQWSVSKEDSLRADDLAANAVRSALAENVENGQSYLESLAVVLTFATSDPGSLKRIHELSNKTNQFNANFSRLSEADVEHRHESATYGFVTVSLRDRLSDSGVIALIGAGYMGGDLIVDEICISCRALGRELESLIVLEAISKLSADFHASRVGLRWQRAPRNGPALAWLALLGGDDLVGDEGLVWQAARPPTPKLPVTVEWEKHR